MTNPGLDRQILAITLPAFAALISEPLMLMTDTAIVGHLGRAELAALGTAGTLLTTIIGLCVFLAYGSTAAVSRQEGAGRHRRAMEMAIGGAWLALVIGVVLAVATHLSAEHVVRWFSSSPEVSDLATSYLQVAAWSIPAVLLVLAATGALRGVLDLRTPLYAMIAANVVNVVLTVALVVVWDFGLPGAAWGLLIAQWFAATWLLGVLYRRARDVDAGTGPAWTDVLSSALDGVPLFIRTATLRGVFLIATAVAAGIGDASLAAHQIVLTLVLFFSFALDAFAIAGQTLTGASLGAGNEHRTRAITQRVIQWGLGFGVLTGILLIAGSTLIPRLFTSDAEVRAAATSALIIVGIFLPISGIVYVLDGVLIGAGDGSFLAWAGLVTLLVYTPAAWWVRQTGADLTWLWAAYGLFMTTRWVTLWWRQRGDTWIVLGAD